MEAPKTVKKNWYRLDNSAKIYPAVMSRNWGLYVPVSLTLKEPVDPAVLQAALEDTVRRIPTFCLSLHRGLFWYYLNASRGSGRWWTGRGQPLQEDGEGGKRRLLFPGAVLPLPDCPWSCFIPSRTGRAP